jgi:hypothetical protein
MIQAHAVAGQAVRPKGSFIHLSIPGRQSMPQFPSAIPQCSAGPVLLKNITAYLVLCYSAFHIHFCYTAILYQVCKPNTQLYSLAFKFANLPPEQKKYSNNYSKWKRCRSKHTIRSGKMPQAPHTPTHTKKWQCHTHLAKPSNTA